MPEARLTAHNVVAAFRHPERATKALQALGEAGIDPPKISLAAPDRHMPPGQDVPSPAREPLMAGVGRYLVVGVVAGTCGGVVLGALVGALLALLPGVGTPAGLLAVYTALAGGVMGQVAVTLLALEAAGRRSTMWEQSLHPLVPLVHRGASLVAVHTDDEERAVRGEEVLQALRPDELEHRDADRVYRTPGVQSAVVGESVPSANPEAPGGRLVGGRRLVNP